MMKPFIPLDAVHGLLLVLDTLVQIPPLSHGHRDPGLTRIDPVTFTRAVVFLWLMMSQLGWNKQITDKLRSSDSRPAPLRLIRSVMDLYLFLRAFLPTLHECTLKAVPCQLVGNCLIYGILPYCPLQLTLDPPRSISAKAASLRAQSTFVLLPFFHTYDMVMT